MKNNSLKTSEKSRVLSLEDGREIFIQGEPAVRIYVLLSGKADLLRGKSSVMQLEEGAVLGAESAFIPDSTYLYTARAAGDVRLAGYTCQEFLDHALAGPKLLHNALFSQGRELRDLWSRADGLHSEGSELFFPQEIRACSPGEWVIREGDRDDLIYRIVSTDKGLEVVKQGQTLAILKQTGDFFGEMAAVLGENRTAGVRSIGESVLEVYPADRLHQMLGDYPGMSMRIIRDLAARLALTSNELIRSSGNT